MNETCTDNRFEVIEKAKKHILEATNIETSPEEMQVLDNILYRCWQMGWLDKYNPRNNGCYVELFAVKDGVKYKAKELSLSETKSILTNGLVDGIEKLWK